MSRPKQLTEDECRALIDETKQALIVLERDLLEARRHALEFAPDGFSAGATDGPRSRGTVSRPTETTVLALNRASDNTGDIWKTDPTAAYHATLRTAVADTRNTLYRLTGVISTIEARAGDPDTQPDTSHRRPALGAGHCRACDRDHTGMPGDRLRGGLCDADRKRFERQPGLWQHDRQAFINAMRIENGLTKTPKAGPA